MLWNENHCCSGHTRNTSRTRKNARIKMAFFAQRRYYGMHVKHFFSSPIYLRSWEISWLSFAMLFELSFFVWTSDSKRSIEMEEIHVLCNYLLLSWLPWYRSDFIVTKDTGSGIFNVRHKNSRSFHERSLCLIGRMPREFKRKPRIFFGKFSNRDTTLLLSARILAVSRSRPLKNIRHRLVPKLPPSSLRETRGSCESRHAST